jgi:hypothetical protein
MTSPTSTNRYQPLALGLALLACLLAALLRIFPPEWNFAPVGALALFAGARLRSWLAFALPLAVMLATDALLAQRPGYSFPYPGMELNYGSFLLYVLLGRTLARTENPLRLGATTLVGSVQFFLISNFGSWLWQAQPYPYTVDGLLQCYAAGVPFFPKTVGSDLLFAATLFGAHALLTRWYFHAERVQNLALANGEGPG